MDSSSITLRKYPYPYRAALSICNDIDGTSFSDFALIHDFLSATGDTPLGPGLGLALADSFWFFSHKNTSDHAFCYFDSDGRTTTPYAPIMRELIQAGTIDTLHSYGNFSQYGGFSRALAQRCLEEMDKHNLHISVWVNHGDEHNLQNIGPAPHHLGDKIMMPSGPDAGRANPNYHSDLLVAGGVRYFWDSETSLTRIIGQNRSCGWREAHYDNLLSRTHLDRLKRMVAGSLATAGQLQPAAPRKGRRSGQNNALLHPETLADGQSLIRFSRFGSGRYDWSDDLAFLLKSEVLDRLTAVEGLSIVYVHWGDRRDKSQAMPFSSETIAACRNLADRFHAGKIWVASTRTLLDYASMVEALDWQVKEAGDHTVIEITDESGAGFNMSNGSSAPDGLTFYCPEPEKTTLNYGGAEVPTQVNPKDYSGRSSLSVPLVARPYPFKLSQLRL